MLYRILMAVLLMSFGVQAFAMSIGNLTVTSYIGEPLRIRIAVTLDQDTLPDDGCYRLVGPSSFQSPLKHAHLGLISVNGQRYVSIHTITPVTDPIIDLTLRTEGCGPTIQKDFVILLSPKGMDEDQPMTITSPASQAAAAKPAPAPRAIRPAHHRHHAVRTQHAGRKPHHRIVHPHRRSTVRAPHFELRLDYSFKSYEHYSDHNAKPQNGHATPPPPPPTSHGDRLVLGSPAEDLPPMSAGQTAGQTPQAAGVTVPHGQPGAGGVATGAHGTGSGPLPAAVAPKSKQITPSIATSLSMVLLLAVMLLLLALLIALWLKWRGRQDSRTPERIAADLNTLMPANPLPRAPRTAAPSLPADEPEPYLPEPGSPTAKSPGFESKPGEPPQAPTLPADLAANLTPTGDFTMEQFETADHVLELAEVMLAFGRSGQAIETLSQYIESHPNQAVDPWLKLLDLYHQSNLRNEFEALAADLHKRFNIVTADWASYDTPPDTHSLTLESLPHIMDRVTSSWGTDTCRIYLDKLLADNRGGQRLGFSLPLVRDILLLREILKQTAPNPYRDSLTS